MIEVKGKMFPVFDFSKPKKSNYIIIEVLGMPAGKNFSVIKIPDNYQIEIGRSQAEMNVPDVSVSKKQATLKYDLSVGELVIQDTNSKFGTHIMIQRPITLKPNKPTFAINGLSLIRLELKKDKFSFDCCNFGGSSSSKYEDETQFLYDDVKLKMPSDLLRYINEDKNMDKILQEPSYKFLDNPVHLMPLSRHAFYMKEDFYFSEPGSARESLEGQHDFYKGATTSKSISIKKSAKLAPQIQA